MQGNPFYLPANRRAAAVVVAAAAMETRLYLMCGVNFGTFDSLSLSVGEEDGSLAVGFRVVCAAPPFCFVE